MKRLGLVDNGQTLSFYMWPGDDAIHRGEKSCLTQKVAGNLPASPMLWTLPKVIGFLGYDPSGDNRTSLGGRLLRYRRSRGMTQEELAKQIGIDPATLG